MAEWDLTKRIVPHLDRHLSMPMLAHLSETPLFAVQDIQLAQYELAKGTNMVDYAAQLFSQLHPDKEIPAEFEEKRRNTLLTHQRLQDEAQAVLDVIENPDVAQALRQDKEHNLQYLKDNYNLTLDQITALYHFGQFQYSYGNYSGAADYLYHFRVLSTDAELNTSAQWGKLASDILSGKWDAALQELDTLRDSIDSRALPGPAINQLHSRTWLLHWSLFVYFNHPSGRTLLLETFLSPVYLNTIQTACPWILRYLAAAAVLSRAPPPGASPRVRSALREVIKVVQMEEYQYQDPVTSFLKELYLEFDFEAAQQQLSLAEQVLSEDFFLGEFAADFLDNARYLITEAYCRTYQKIDIRDLSQRLNLSPDEGEKWVVNLIRESRMGADAKIDLDKNVIEIFRPAAPVYQSVIDKTRGLHLRTSGLGTAISRIGSGVPASAADTTVAVR
ncbi:Eukaryotic translation initiation factor 3 subunit E [Mycena chlorophos]|uniref:Eukaryotic translation initiation factor 3 subunit E n=1 Tax=Mycena chlorophos TaxID=658473 RepID=A0A8H6SFR3_MYCCL|nr:Eukaryotic translation initiation factor 3 subunit E [Mycena chlorophos]